MVPLRAHEGRPGADGYAQKSEGSGFSDPITIDLTPCGLALHLDAFVEPLEIDGEVVGALIVFPRSGMGDPLDRLVAQEAKLALNVQLLRGHVRFRSHAASSADLLAELIREGPDGGNDAFSRASGLGIDLSSPACLLAIGVPEAPGIGRLEHLHRALTQLTARLWPGGVVARHAAAFVILLPGAETSRVATLGRRIVREMVWRQGAEPAVVLSTPCATLEDYRRAWRGCIRILALARSFNRTGILSSEAFGPFAELLTALDQTAVKDFVARTLGAAVSYDTRHNAHLVETASEYVKSGCRYRACATRLGIHVSTLRYRIAREFRN